MKQPRHRGAPKRTRKHTKEDPTNSTPDPPKVLPGFDDLLGSGLNLSDIHFGDFPEMELFPSVELFDFASIEPLSNIGFADISDLNLDVILGDRPETADPPGIPVKATAAGVARWMVEKLNLTSHLYQHQVVLQIRAKFGGEHVYNNRNGNLAISKDVLREFRALTPDVVWSKSGRYPFWRKRTERDGPSRSAE